MPLPPDVIVIQETVGIAVQLAQAAALETVKLLIPPLLFGLALYDESEVAHETPSCVTVKVAPPVIVIVAVREVVPVLAETE